MAVSMKRRGFMNCVLATCLSSGLPGRCKLVLARGSLRDSVDCGEIVSLQCSLTTIGSRCRAQIVSV